MHGAEGGKTGDAEDRKRVDGEQDILSIYALNEMN